MKPCDRCGKRKKDVKQMGVDNYMGHGDSSSWHYFACEQCAHVIGCLLDNAFVEFSLDWRKPPLKVKKVKEDE